MEAADFKDLPNVVLRGIIGCILPHPFCLDAAPSTWRPILRLLTSGNNPAHEAVFDILRDAIPALSASEPGSWLSCTSFLSAVRGGGRGSWEKIRTIRAIRFPTQTSTPLQSAPKLSGASLCLMPCGKFVVFGGRCSLSGNTLGNTYVVQLPSRSSDVAQWQELHCEPRPPARCYHSATRGSKSTGMTVFGGASGDSLLSDVWWLELSSYQAVPAGVSSIGRWRPCDLSQNPRSPCARSCHVCSTWGPDGYAVLHGGLGGVNAIGGTMSDTWLFHPGGKCDEIHTTGPRIARAHHCGGVVNSSLVVYSGQDEHYLTVNNLCILQLETAVWEEVDLPSGPSPRIDAAAAVLEGVGVLVFGGVGVHFEFEPAAAWLISSNSKASSHSPVTSSMSNEPGSRACCSMCTDGLSAYIFGGFDGQQDLGDLWRLTVAPRSVRSGVELLAEVARGA